jgi:hypothetical protein
VNTTDSAFGPELVKAICESMGLIQGSHHGRADFRLNGKIVVNLEDDASITIKVPLDEQQALLSDYPEHVSLPNGWGHHGWTTLHIDQFDRDIVEELIDTSIRTVASSKRNGRKATG